MTASRNITLGRFRPDEGGKLRGAVSALGMGTTPAAAIPAVSLAGVPYMKLVGDPDGAAYQFGAAFPKTKDGVGYYSVIMESPLFAEPMSGTLYPDRFEPQSFNMIWHRIETAVPSQELKSSRTHAGHMRISTFNMAP